MTNLKVLVVDEMATMRRILRNMLGELGISNVVEAPDANAASEILKNGDVDLVIVDVGDNVPAEDGLALIRSIRANPPLALTAILAHTMTKDCVTAALEAMANDYTGWPFTCATLHDKIGKVMNQAAPI